MAQNWIKLRLNFVRDFQEIHKTLAWACFLRVKNAWKMIKITDFDLLRGPFIDLGQMPNGSSKIIKNWHKSSNASKSVAKWRRKNTDSGLTKAKTTPHRFTCQNASKCVRFCCSWCHSLGKNGKMCRKFRLSVQSVIWTWPEALDVHFADSVEEMSITRVCNSDFGMHYLFWYNFT